jgi:hypothetical protein
VGVQPFVLKERTTLLLPGGLALGLVSNIVYNNICEYNTCITGNTDFGTENESF